MYDAFKLTHARLLFHALLHRLALVSAVANFVWTAARFGKRYNLSIPTEKAQSGRRQRGLAEQYCHLGDLGLPGPVHLFTTINAAELSSKGVPFLDMIDDFISHYEAVGVSIRNMQFVIRTIDTMAQADIESSLRQRGIAEVQASFLDTYFDEDIAMSVINGYMELLSSDAWLVLPEINELFYFPCARYPPAPMKATCGQIIDRFSSDCIVNLRGPGGVFNQTALQSRKHMLFPVQVDYPGLGLYNARHTRGNRLKYVSEDNHRNERTARCEEQVGVIEAFMEYTKDQVDSALSSRIGAESNIHLQRGMCPISNERGWYSNKFDGLDPVHVVYAANDDSVAGVEASIRSVLAHSSGPLEFYFIGGKPLPSMPSVHWFNLTDIVSRYHLEDYMNTNERTDRDDSINLMHSNYARFSLEFIMPAAASKIMYIDVDTIVLCDVYSLVNSVLTDESNDTPLAAIPRYDVDKQSASVIWGLTKSGAKFVEEKNLIKSFNAGVYVANLDVWRQQKLSEKMRKVALLNRKLSLYSYGSQPPMNIVIGSNFEDLPIGWNVCPKKKHIRRVKEEGGALCLLHYTGEGKPWHGESNYKLVTEWDRFGTRVK